MTNINYDGIYPNQKLEMTDKNTHEHANGLIHSHEQGAYKHNHDFNNPEQKQQVREKAISRIREGLVKDFNDLYVKEFTTEWKMERFCRKSEINLMSFDNTIKSLLKEVEGIENPHNGGLNTAEYYTGIGFYEAIKAVKKRLGK